LGWWGGTKQSTKEEGTREILDQLPTGQNLMKTNQKGASGRRNKIEESRRQAAKSTKERKNAQQRGMTRGIFKKLVQSEFKGKRKDEPGGYLNKRGGGGKFSDYIEK